MLLLLVGLLGVADAGWSAPAPGACSFISARGMDLVVYADTRVGDDGDVLVSYRLDPGQISPPIAPQGGARLRFKYRANKQESWTYSYSTECSSQKPIAIR